MFCQIAQKHYVHVGEVRKIKHHLIVCFLSNMHPRNYQNRFMYVEVIARRRWDTYCNCFSYLAPFPRYYYFSTIYGIYATLCDLDHPFILVFTVKNIGLA